MLFIGLPVSYFTLMKLKQLDWINILPVMLWNVMLHVRDEHLELNIFIAQISCWITHVKCAGGFSLFIQYFEHERVDIHIEQPLF